MKDDLIALALGAIIAVLLFVAAPLGRVDAVSHVEGQPVNWSTYCNHRCRCDGCRSAASEYRKKERSTERGEGLDDAFASITETVRVLDQDDGCRWGGFTGRLSMGAEYIQVAGQELFDLWEAIREARALILNEAHGPDALPDAVMQALHILIELDASPDFCESCGRTDREHNRWQLTRYEDNGAPTTWVEQCPDAWHSATGGAS